MRKAIKLNEIIKNSKLKCRKMLLQCDNRSFNKILTSDSTKFTQLQKIGFNND